MLDQNVAYQPPGAKAAEERYLASQSKRNFFQSLREKLSKNNFESDHGDRSGATQIQIIERAKGFLSDSGKWILLVLGIVGVAAILYFKPPTFGPIGGIRFSGPALATLVIRFSELAFLGTGLLSFTEADDRNDPLLLDWWLAFVEWLILIWVGKTGLTFTTGLTAGIGFGGLVVGTFWNRGEETEKSLWNRWDTSGLFTLSFALIITHLAK